MISQTEWVSVPEAADYLGCSRTWVLYLLNQGLLEGQRLSQKAWMVKRAALKQNLAEYIERTRLKKRGRLRRGFS